MALKFIFYLFAFILFSYLGYAFYMLFDALLKGNI